MKAWFIICVAAGCTSDARRVEVTSGNSIGVVALTWDRFDDRGNDVFVVRGLSADDDERAAVQVTRGTVTMTGHEREPGSEIIASVAGAHTRVTSRETRQLVYNTALSGRPQVASFVALAEVSALLKKEANVLVKTHEITTTPERPYYNTQTCDPRNLNQTPTAYECCEDHWNDSYPAEYMPYAAGAPTDTMFLKDAFTVSYRFNSAGEFALAEDGYTPIYLGYWSDGWFVRATCINPQGGACRGRDCYYGPNGYAKASLYTSYDYWGVAYYPENGEIAAAYPYAHVYNDSGLGGFCMSGFYSSPQPPQFGTVDGYFPSSQGCPGGDDGAGEWDY